jgi:hypothetical protein
MKYAVEMGPVLVIYIYIYIYISSIIKIGSGISKLTQEVCRHGQKLWRSLKRALGM